MTGEDVKRSKDRAAALEDAKEVAFDAACYANLLENNTQKEKSLLALSSVGIGLLVSIVSVRDGWSVLAQTLIIVALVCFMLTILMSFLCFTANADRIKFQVKPPGLKGTDKETFWSKRIIWWDYGGSIFFAVAVIALSAWGVVETTAKV